MKRRTFIKTLAGLGSGMVSLPALSSTAKAKEEKDVSFKKSYPGGAFNREVLKQLENEYLQVTVYSDGSADLVDKKTGTRWRMGRVALQEEGPVDVGHVWLKTGRSICEQYPGRFLGRRVGNSIRFTLLGHRLVKMGTFMCDVRLDGPWLEFRLSNIDERLPSLVFPTPIESESLVFPSGVGQWLRKPIPDRRFLTFFSHLNMRWFGGLKGDSGWLAVFHKEFADAGVMAAELSASPGWLKSLGRWSYPRSVRYRFTKGGYVGLAKAYRKWAIENGLHKSLVEKMAEIPALKNTLGGRFVSITQACPAYARQYFENRLKKYDETMIDGKLKKNVTHAEAVKIIKQMKRLGMKKGAVLLRGWISGGYDWSHPDIWPPTQELGSIEELKALCALVNPITVGLHDNYQDIYEQCASFPEGVIRKANGELMAGGYWSGGQAYILNSRDGVKYAKRNWGQIKTLNPASMFIDTTTTVQAYQSFEPGNTLTRSQDVESKSELLRFFDKNKIILGSEGGADFGVPYADYFTTWHWRTAGESVPLWPLVFHDAVFCTRLRHSSFCVCIQYKQSTTPHWLEDMLWGYLVFFGIDDVADWEEQKKDFKATFHVDNWHERIGAEEMTNHRYLTGDFLVEETTFANGLAIVVNFSREERVVEGIRVPACGYVIRD